jgi:hypothetical protein
LILVEGGSLEVVACAARHGPVLYHGGRVQEAGAGDGIGYVVFGVEVEVERRTAASLR